MRKREQPKSIILMVVKYKDEEGWLQVMTSRFKTITYRHSQISN